MNRLLILLPLLALSLFSVTLWASDRQIIDTLGVSSKGQFVALEEYGYSESTHKYYVRVKVMNVWTKKYVGKTTELEVPADRPSQLKNARDQVRFLVRDDLKEFGISV